MPSVMRNINTICRSASMYRAQNSSDNRPGIYHSYIFVIKNHPGLSQDKLAKALCVNKSNVTRHVTFLEGNGYIERQPGKDKREMLIFPTEKLLSAYPEVHDISKKWYSLISESLSADELEFLEKTLQKLAEKAAGIIYSAEDDQ